MLGIQEIRRCKVEQANIKFDTPPVFLPAKEGKNGAALTFRLESYIGSGITFIVPKGLIPIFKEQLKGEQLHGDFVISIAFMKNGMFELKIKVKELYELEKPALEVQINQQFSTTRLYLRDLFNSYHFRVGKFEIKIGGEKMDKKIKCKENIAYKTFGYELHGRTSFYLFYPSELKLKFPLEGYKIKQLSSYIYVLVPDENYITFDIYQGGGYRGASFWKVSECPECIVADYLIYRSPRGSLGAYQGLLISKPKGKNVKLDWETSGRTYGCPKHIQYILTDNGLEELAPIDIDICEIEKEIKGD